MNTLKLLIRNILVRLELPPSTLDGIVDDGFVQVPDNFGPFSDLELYAREDERIVYNGYTDEIVKRYEERKIYKEE
jgi:hypothetical protein